MITLYFHVLGFVSHSSLGVESCVVALAAASVGLLMGETVENIVRGLSSYTASGMRQNIYEQNGFRIYADCYNASPDAMEATLGVLGTMGDTGRRIAVLGSMLELGDYTEEGHRRAGSPFRAWSADFQKRCL